MTLDNLKSLINFNYNHNFGKDGFNAEDPQPDEITAKYLYITGQSFTKISPEGVNMTLDEIDESIENEKEKEALWDKLAWAIPGGARFINTAVDVNKDGELSEDDKTALEEIVAKEDKTDEDIQKGDVNKDGKVDEKDIKEVEDILESLFVVNEEDEDGPNVGLQDEELEPGLEAM